MATDRLTFEMMSYVTKNPDEAENQEDLLNWGCEKFRIDDEKVVDELHTYIRKHSDLPS